MPQDDEKRMLSRFRKYGGLVVRGVISSQEFINGAFELFAHVEGVYVDIVPLLFEFVPEFIRSEFSAACRRATQPDFRWHPFHIGGSRPPMTEDELRRDANLRTSRVQAWAIAFMRYIDTSSVVHG